jgi:hypothetical protein
MRVETLAADVDHSGRRNWSKCQEFTDVIHTPALLFPDDCVTQAALSELSEQDEQAVHPAIASCIEQLIEQQKHGANVQVKLDTQLFISMLPRALQPLFISKIEVLPAHLLHPDQVSDIGHIVRDIMLNRQRQSMLFKVYQYTMPFTSTTISISPP